jgi:hypothetical protein
MQEDAVEVPVALPGEGTQEVPHIDVQPVARPFVAPIEQLNGLISDDARLGRVTPTPEAIKILAPLVKNWPHNWFRNDTSRADVGGFRLIGWEELSDPDAARRLRGEPVEVVGTVKPGTYQAVDPSKYDLSAEDFPLPLFEGTLLVEGGDEVRFLLVQSSDGGQLSIPASGEVFKLMGVFYRLTEEDLDGTGLKVRPFLLATRLSPKIPLKLHDEFAADIEERIEELEQMNVRSSPQSERTFYEVLGYVLKKGEAAIPEGATIMDLVGYDPRDKPELYRLKPVRATGRVVYVGRESFEHPDMRREDSPILGYWHIIVAREPLDDYVPVSIILPTEDIPEVLRKWVGVNPAKAGVRPVVTVEGLYYRVHGYEARGKKRRPEEVHLPMMVATKLLEARVDEGKPTEIHGFMLGFIGVGAVLIFCLVFVTWRDRKRADVLAERIRTERLSRRKREGMDLNKDWKSRP